MGTRITSGNDTFTGFINHCRSCRESFRVTKAAIRDIQENNAYSEDEQPNDAEAANLVDVCTECTTGDPVVGEKPWPGTRFVVLARDDGHRRLASRECDNLEGARIIWRWWKSKMDPSTMNRWTFDGVVRIELRRVNHEGENELLDYVDAA